MRPGLFIWEPWVMSTDSAIGALRQDILVHAA